MVSFFESMKPEDLARVCAESVEVKYGAGDLIIAEGDEADAMYVLMHGTAAAEKTVGEDTMELRPYDTIGDTFGELAMLCQTTRRLADVRATTDVLVICISKDNFLGVSAISQMQRKTLKVAVLGAGPVGLEFAASAALRGLSVVMIESGAKIASNVRRWGHVRLFSPNEMNVSDDSRAVLQAAGVPTPADGVFPTGAEYISTYLEPLAEALEARGNVEFRFHSRAVSVGRDNILKGQEIGTGARVGVPFRVAIQPTGTARQIAASGRQEERLEGFDGALAPPVQTSRP